MTVKDPRRIEYRPLDKIVPATRNAKRHDPRIGTAIGELGYIESMVEDGRTGRLIAGHGRLDQLVAKHAAGEDPPDGIVVRGGVWHAPVTVGWESRDDQHAEAANLALNRLTERGGWDDETLAAMLADQPDPGWIGWDEDDLAALLADSGGPDLAAGDSDTDPDDVPDTAPAITEPGDVWLLGDHRLMCGDCRDPADVERLLAGASINVAFTSPPYAEQRTYDESSGFKPIPPDEYVEWFAPVAANVAANLAGDGSWFVNIKAASRGLDTETYVLDLVLAHARRWGWHWVTEFCWERGGVPGTPSRRFKNQFEPVYQFAKGEWKFRPDSVRHASTRLPAYSTDGLDEYTMRSNRSTVGMSEMQGTGADVGEAITSGLAYPGNRLPTFAGSHTATGHGAAFPVGLPQWFVKAYSDPGDAVYDPFVGSGSTILAAHIEKRVGFGMEISPAYCDIVLKRFQQLTGVMPARADGVPVDFIGGT